MAFQYRTQGFVFKKDDRFESDRNFSVFTKDFGRVEVLGKSIRKITSKLRSGIEVFSLSEIEFVQGKNRKTLTDAVIDKKFNKIYTPQKLEVSYKISELVDSFIKGEEKDENILSLLKEAFEKLDSYEKNNINIVYLYFFWNFISLLGYAPEVSKCATCQQRLNPYFLYFSNKDGGVICKNCAQSKKDCIRIKSDIVKILRLILKKDWDTISRLKLEKDSTNPIIDISDKYKSYLLLSNNFKQS